MKSDYSKQSATMAILNVPGGQIEVVVVKHPDGTIYEEHVKLGEREKPDAKECDRYIVGEPGAKFYIKVKPLKGFNFGKCKWVSVRLLVPGLPAELIRKSLDAPKQGSSSIGQDMELKLEYIAALENGQKTKEVRPSFKPLDVDENLPTQTDVSGLNSTDLGCFTIKIRSTMSTDRSRTSKQYENALQEWERKVRDIANSLKAPLIAARVDQESQNKHGISCAIG